MLGTIEICVAFGQIQPPTLLAKLLIQSINIWDKWKRVGQQLILCYVEVKFNV